MLLQRLRTHFPLALVTLFGAITVLGILPFALYRFAHGQWQVGLIDLFIVMCISTGVAYAWRSGKTEGATLFIAITYSAGCVAIAHIGGLSGMLWAFPVMMANFLLTGRGTAVAISALAIVGVMLSDAALPETLDKLMFAATSFVVSLFAYVFAWRADMQRKQLEAIAAHDPLTGAYNRRGMDTELDIAIASSMRNRAPLGLLVFDLDHFKRINDAYGHESGDAVLVQLAQLVHRVTRKSDRFFRMGGEEFGLLLPGAHPDCLRTIAEKLRATIEDEVRCGDEVITVSIGATTFVPGEAAAELLARADAAMYQAKHEGRNRLVVQDVADAFPLPTVLDPLSMRRHPHAALQQNAVEVTQDHERLSQSKH